MIHFDVFQVVSFALCTSVTIHMGIRVMRAWYTTYKDKTVVVRRLT